MTKAIYAVAVTLGSCGLLLAQQSSPALARLSENQSCVLVVDGRLVTETSYQGYNHEDTLRAYARSHGGSYVAFSKGGILRRLDSPAAVKRVQQAYAPMVPLAAEQERLAAQMKPLSDRQAELTKKMNLAVGPENVGRVGQEQGEVGRQQGEIGQQQGRIGREQGKAGTALEATFRKVSEECLAAESCPVVTDQKNK